MLGSRKIETRPYDCLQCHYGHLTREEALEKYPESGISPTGIDGESAFAVTWSGDALGLIAGYIECGIWINFINRHTGTIDNGAPIWMRMKVLGTPSWQDNAQADIRLRYLIQI